MIKDVNVIITRQTNPLSQAGFGLPLIVATNTTKAYTEYTELTEVALDYASTTNAYKIANAMLSQNPRPEKIAIIGVVYTSTAMARATLETNLTGTNNDLKFTSKLAGENGNNIEIVYIDPGSTTASTTAVRAGSGTDADPYVITVTLADDGTNITATAAQVKAAIEANANCNAIVLVEYAASNDGTGVVTALAQTPLTSGSNGSTPTAITTALDTLIETNDDWYFLTSDLQNYNDIVALSSYVNTKDKQYFASTKDYDSFFGYPTTNPLNSENTILMYHDKADTEFPAEAWVGVCAPLGVGEITWKFKTLVGISEADVTTTQILNIHTKHGNTYVKKYGILQTSEGLTTSGEYIDVIRGEDYIKARMTEKVSTSLFTLPKVPYDNRGLAVIEADIRTVLRDATTEGIIAVDSNGVGQYSVTMPALSSISANDKAQRKLTGIKWTATLAGAVHEVTIRGTLTI